MVGILTFHRAINYGALLQAYALHKVLIDLGIQNVIINYRCDHIEKEYCIFTDYKYCGNIKGKFIRTLNLPAIIIKKNKFNKFIKQHITLCPNKLLSRNDLLKNWRSTGFDYFITGSDQVWHNGVTNFDKTYFLDFITEPERKISYAASFGFSEIPSQHLSEYKYLLSDFGHISVREKSGAEIIRKITNKDVPIVLDPTLLLNKSDWLTISSNNVKIINYILIFCIIITDSIKAFAEELRKLTGYIIISIDNKISSSFKATGSLGIGPKEFLSLFKNANFIVTNSYHGTAFSINFNKDFFVEIQSSPNNTNCRILQLINLFELDDRVINNKSCKLNLLKPIQYDKINSILKSEINNSISFLKILSG